MVDDEKVTYADIKQKGTNVAKIIIKREADKSTVLLALKDGTKRQVGENLDTVSLFGVRTSPEAGGPFFIAIIEEGILDVYEEILYKMREEKMPVERNMRIYLPIW